MTMKPRNLRRVAVWTGIVIAWWCLSRKSPLQSPGSAIITHPIQIKRTVTVAPGMESNLQISFPPSKTPGWLRGTWTVKGATGNVRGAHDDSLVGFVLTAPNGKIIQNRAHPLTGN